MIYHALAALASASISYLVTPLFCKAMRKIGHTRPDVHKPGHPQVPYSGGVVLYTATTFSLLVVAVLKSGVLPKLSVVWAVSTVAFLIGLFDDFKVLGARVKTALTLLAVLPLLGAYLLLPHQIRLGRPLVPILGRLRITIVYWLLIPLIAAGPANAVNMLDVFNGVMPSTALSTSAALLLAALLLGNSEGALLIAPLLGALAGYLPYNKWPAKVLNGDSGSLMVGAYIGAAAAVLNLEFVAMVALMPHIINGALVIGSVGGLKEHRQMKGRPVSILADYKLAATSDAQAPISLTRVLLAVEGPMPERDIANRLILLGVVSSTLAALSAALIPR